MSVKQFVLGPVGTNCYLYTDDKTGISAVIDPAYGSEKLFAAARATQVDYILITHAHADHIMAANELRNITGAKIAAHKNEAQRLCNAQESLYESLGCYSEPFVPAPADILLDGGDKINVGETVFTVLHTPGHTDGSVCFVDDELIFSGDTLFFESYGRVDFPSGSWSQMIDSFYLLSQIKGDRYVYPGHMQGTTLKNEREFNPLKRYI